MPFDESADLAAIFRTADFGTEVIVDGARRVNGIFEAEYAEVLGMASSGPALTCASADVSTLKVGGQVEAAGTLYRVTGLEPDGTGMTVVKLARAAQ